MGHYYRAESQFFPKWPKFSIISLFLQTLAQVAILSTFVKYRRLSRSKQLGGLVPVLRLGVPLRCKATKLEYPLLLNQKLYHTYIKKDQLNCILWGFSKKVRQASNDIIGLTLCKNGVRFEPFKNGTRIQPCKNGVRIQPFKNGVWIEPFKMVFGSSPSKMVF